MQAVLAVYSDWGIGRDGTQPEVIPEDRAHFQKLTRGNCVIYGRKTMLDFPGSRPLKGRDNIIISSTLKSVEGAMVAATKEEALELSKQFENVFVIGGASVFNLFMEDLSKVYITKVFSEPVSDVFFLNLDEDEAWHISEQSEVLVSENGMKYQYLTYEKKEQKEQKMANIKNIYLAGGCFWGVEYFFGWLKGVLETEVGYANGDCEENANYRTVLTGQTGFRECVKLSFDIDEVSLDTLLHTFFYLIDTESENRQGPDVGTQYQSGIYYDDLELKDEIERIAAVEKKRTPGFAVEVKELKNYFKAEKEHQKYLIKNPKGYCHISPLLLDFFTDMKIDPKNYKLPGEAEIKDKLTPMQYEVTQNAGTEPPFENEYFDKFEEGIYVDIVTGEPLFSSKDKFKSSCGWPAFKKPIELPSIFEKPDNSGGMRRIEVVSRTGSTHLGHLFTSDPESPNGLRYCINSASLRFIPKDKMEKEGYGYLLYLLA